MEGVIVYWQILSCSSRKYYSFFWRKWPKYTFHENYFAHYVIHFFKKNTKWYTKEGNSKSQNLFRASVLFPLYFILSFSESLIPAYLALQNFCNSIMQTFGKQSILCFLQFWRMKDLLGILYFQIARKPLYIPLINAHFKSQHSVN